MRCDRTEYSTVRPFLCGKRRFDRCAPTQRCDKHEKENRRLSQRNSSLVTQVSHPPIHDPRIIVRLYVSREHFVCGCVVCVQCAPLPCFFPAFELCGQRANALPRPLCPRPARTPCRPPALLWSLAAWPSFHSQPDLLAFRRFLLRRRGRCARGWLRPACRWGIWGRAQHSSRRTNARMGRRPSP